MAMHAAPRTPRRRVPKLSHPGTAVMVVVLAVLGLASQCGSQAETSNSAPTITVPSSTPPVPPAKAPQPAGNETADANRVLPAELPDPEPVPTWAPAPDVDSADTGSEDNGGSVYYKNCAAARAAGVTPLYAGESGYSSKLDRDGDGVACE
ncbi:MAG: excalibur calcium-binding domain-containing protein [Pseudonocardiaceae bacterium]